MCICILSISGTIDEISKEVNMTWVQPRVLDLDQVCFRINGVLGINDF